MSEVRRTGQHAAYVHIIRRMTGSQRVRIAMDLHDFEKEMQVIECRARNPQLSAEQAHRLCRLLWACEAFDSSERKRQLVAGRRP